MQMIQRQKAGMYVGGSLAIDQSEWQNVAKLSYDDRRRTLTAS